MKNIFGNAVTLTLFGESHGAAIGAVLDGLAPGIEVDEEYIKGQLSLRRPQDALSTPRREQDEFSIVSGVYNGKTTGTPLCILIPNRDTKSADYGEIAIKCRPGHADYTGFVKYGGFNDPRGGGHFSGRITAAIVAAGAILLSALKARGITVATHIASIGSVSDRDFSDLLADMRELNGKAFAVLDSAAEEKMKAEILAAKAEGDSIGGTLETVVLGMPAGVGEPWFDTVEGLLSHAIFSIPAVKGIEFGKGFSLAGMRGSEANDPFIISDGKIATETNNAGGILGGITSGMPILFKTAIKPTPTISREQKTVDIKAEAETTLAAAGRHDPCIVHRARVVVDSVTALVLCDILTQKYGTDGFLK